MNTILEGEALRWAVVYALGGTRDQFTSDFGPARYDIDTSLVFQLVENGFSLLIEPTFYSGVEPKPLYRVKLSRKNVSYEVEHNIIPTAAWNAWLRHHAD